MQVIVTRPAAQAARWVQLLAARAIDAAALPLIEISPAADKAALSLAWQELPRYRLVVFVSSNAALSFFAQKPAPSAWPRDVLAGSTGPGTSSTLMELGVPREQLVEPSSTAVQFDSESLWSELGARDWRGANVLILRGHGGRDWLTQTLRGQGAKVVHLAAYRRTAPRLSELEQGLLHRAIDEPRSFVWYFSSSEAMGNLRALVPLTNQDCWRRSRAIATHPRVAERAREMGFAQVLLSRPSLDAVVACIQSLQP
jgi:uroporphyrinogen-III synthase